MTDWARTVTDSLVRMGAAEIPDIDPESYRVRVLPGLEVAISRFGVTAWLIRAEGDRPRFLGSAEMSADRVTELLLSALEQWMRPFWTDARDLFEKHSLTLRLGEGDEQLTPRIVMGGRTLWTAGQVTRYADVIRARQALEDALAVAAMEEEA